MLCVISELVKKSHSLELMICAKNKARWIHFSLSDNRPGLELAEMNYLSIPNCFEIDRNS